MRTSTIQKDIFTIQTMYSELSRLITAWEEEKMNVELGNTSLRLQILKGEIETKYKKIEETQNNIKKIIFKN